MKLNLRLQIEFDDDSETVLIRKVWLKHLPSIDPTHAIIKALIVDAKAEKRK